MAEANTTVLPRATGSTGSTGLPPLLQKRARERLRMIPVILAALSVIPLGLTLFGFPNITSIPIHAAVLAISAALYFVTSSERVSDAAAIDAGLVAMVAYAAALSFPITYLQLSNDGHFYDLTWTCIVILLIPLFAPSRPDRIVVAGLLAASTSPLGVVLASQLLDRPLRAQDLIGMSLTPLFCVVFAYVGARMVYRLGVDAARAQEMGSYQLVEKLGAGGMGEVWSAHHRMLARPAAIKLIRRDLGAGAAAERFEREAQVTSALKSPHTVELYDFGISDEGTVYYVMELLDGLDFEALVQEHGSLPPARAVHFLKQVCHSLHEAHEAGLVHRDIKPANIFACRHGLDFDVAKVLDFGLVSLQRDPERTLLTDAHSVPGTPAYLAPEIARGEAVDRRADLYALGCVAFWLLTGRRVFEADSPLQAAIAHVEREPEAPSSVNPEVPKALDDLVLGLLKKQPDERPATARAVSDALCTLEGVPTWSETQARQWWTVRKRVGARA